MDMKQSDLGFSPDLRAAALPVCDFCVVLKVDNVVLSDTRKWWMGWKYCIL